MRKSIALFLVLLTLFSVFVFVACKGVSEPSNRYELACEYRPEDRALSGAVKVRFKNPYSAPLSKIKFFLYPNAYRKGALFPAVSSAIRDEAYYQGESYGEISVSSVHGAIGWEVEGEDENILTAILEEPLEEGEETVLDIGFTTRLPFVNHKLGVTERTVNLSGFYPVLCLLSEEGFEERAVSSFGDSFISDPAEYLVKLTVPKEYKLACSGETVEESTLESKKKYTLSLKNAREFSAVLSKDFRVIAHTQAGRRVEYYYLSDPMPQKTLETASSALTYYSSVFGEYAYGRYAIAETCLPFFGVEGTAFSMILEGGDEKERMRAVAHETAHQWWYAAVGSNPFQEAWQDEGLAEYSAVLFLSEKGWSREELVTASLKEYRAYAKTYLEALGWVDRRMSRPLTEYLSEYEYVCISVHKSVVMFDELRKATGDKKFFAGLKKYYTENKFKSAKMESLVGAYERIGVELQGFFEGFLTGKEETK